MKGKEEMVQALISGGVSKVGHPPTWGAVSHGLRVVASSLPGHGGQSEALKPTTESREQSCMATRLPSVQQLPCVALSPSF